MAPSVMTDGDLRVSFPTDRNGDHALQQKGPCVTVPGFCFRLSPHCRGRAGLRDR